MYDYLPVWSKAKATPTVNCIVCSDNEKTKKKGIYNIDTNLFFGECQRQDTGLAAELDVILDSL